MGDFIADSFHPEDGGKIDEASYAGRNFRDGMSLGNMALDAKQ